MIPIPYRWLAGVLIFAGIVTASWLSGVHHEHGVMQARIDALKAQYAQATIKAQAQADAKAEEQAQAFQKTAQDYERKISEQSKQHAADVAAIRAGTLRLRDSAGICNPAPQAPAPASGGDGSPGCELSQQFSEFLLGEADRADKIVMQLAACQAVIIEDRR